MADLTYIHQRLDTLHDIDTKLVSALDDLSSIFSTLQKGKSQGNGEELEKEFVSNVTSFYSNLSNASIELRKEIKCLDDKISNNDTDGGDFSILPININKKAVWTSERKLKQEVGILNELLGETKGETNDNETTDNGNDIVMA